jgi:hypothetical protein
MKTLFVALVVLFFAFIIGCQENSITDPVTNDTGAEFTTTTAPDMDKDLISAYPGVIKLAGSIYDPSHRLNSFAEIKGIVRYGLDQINTDKRPPRPAIKVKLYVNTELKSNCPMQDRPWTVNKTAEDVIYLSSANLSVYNLEKSFRVCNTCCAPLNLVLKFQVDKKVVTLVSMELKRVPGLTPISDPEM